MKRIFLVGLVLVVFSVSLCGLGAGMPAMAAAGESVDAVPVEQPSDLRAISAMPVWGWMLIVPAVGLMLALCAAPMLVEESAEV